MKKICIYIVVVLISFVFYIDSNETTGRADTYHISHTTSFVWEASCDVSASDSMIKKVVNIDTHALTGHLIKVYLTKESNYQYTLHITQKIGVLTSRYGLRLKYFNHKIIVTVI